MILALLLLSSSFLNPVSDLPVCRNEQLKQFVAHIEDVSNIYELMILWSEPAEAAACLIGNLRPVNVGALHPDEKNDRRDEFRTLWSLRALRYLTGGKNFCGTTAHFGELNADQSQFLTIRCGPAPEVSFFGTWMSRDIVFFAPIDAQEQIIRQWINWYRKEGISYPYTPAKSIDDWYF